LKVRKSPLSPALIDENQSINLAIWFFFWTKDCHQVKRNGGKQNRGENYKHLKVVKMQ